ncbi:MAG: biopolymer transporter ExbD [Bacteroidales bacterium]|jgi:biopolymer transport protein ExbD|nr:biopolymer transporter ExbD [Bacteroidales bacterium]
MARKAVEVNTGAMADISFLLLTFFLLTSSIDTDMGIIRKLPPPPDPTQEIQDVKKRNIFNVLINKYDGLLVQGRPMDISQLRDAAKEFLANPYNREDLPEKRTEVIEGLGSIDISKGVISLKNDRGTSYKMYIEVQNELTAAVSELRNELSKQRFGMAYSDLTNTVNQEAISAAIPVAISEAEPENVGGTK